MGGYRWADLGSRPQLLPRRHNSPEIKTSVPAALAETVADIPRFSLTSEREDLTFIPANQLRGNR
jgi:hypothetical protein